MSESTTRIPLKTPFFYGWVIVLICGIILLVAFGVRLSFSVFFVALLEEFAWPRADTAFIFSVTMIVFTLTSTSAGILLDRYGVRRVFTAGAGLLALGLWLSSRVNTLWQLAVTYGVIVGLGITILGLGLQASVVARWFRRKRGLAIGLAFAGTGVGPLFIIPMTEVLISRVGWRSAYLVLAVFGLAVIPLIVLFLRLSPIKVGLLPDGDTTIVRFDSLAVSEPPQWQIGQVTRYAPFWLLLVASLGAIGPLRMITVHQLAVMIDAGIDRLQAATIIGFTGAVTAVAFIFWGFLSDRLGRPQVYTLGTLCLLGAMAILDRLNSFPSPAILWFYALALGFGEGSRASLITAVASDMFPGNALGAVNGAVGAAFGAGAAFFPWLAGWLFDSFGSYTLAFNIAGASVILSLISLWLATILRTRRPLQVLPTEESTLS